MLTAEKPLQLSLEHLFYAVAKLLCDDYVLDCTNGMSLRDSQGKMLAGGPNLVARYILRQVIKENANE